MYLQGLADTELLAYAEQTLDPLTSSDLERELIKRLNALVLDAEGDERTAVLDEQGFDDAEALREHFATVDKIKSAADAL